MKPLSLLTAVWVALVLLPGSAQAETAAHDGTPIAYPSVTLERTGPPPRKSMPASIHPDVRLLAEGGQSVLDNHEPLSLMKTCGACHDTAYIQEHNYHAQAGMDEAHLPGEGASGRAWDTSPGLFGHWDPLIYRWLTPPGTDKLDLGTADWIRVMGARHVGGGPATHSRIDGKPLGELVPTEAVHPDTHVLEPQTGQVIPWDWSQSGTLELDCLLCHMKTPDNAQRIRTIREGQFRWASTATLLGSDLVERDADGFRWNRERFDAQGAVSAESLKISEPGNANCRQCHGRACRCIDPVVFENSLENWSTEVTGSVFSPDRMFDSGMNLKHKAALSSPWDVHAERLVGCTDCHHSMNNPAYNRKEGPRHLTFDARTLNQGAYLITPDHNLAKGHTAQGTVARRFANSMRGCSDCHDAEAVHDFLPYKKMHFQRLGCQTCHVPQVYAPVRQATDWTLLTPGKEALVTHRGAQGPINDPTTLIPGYQPLLLLHQAGAGDPVLAPHNVITSWFWVEGQPERPVRHFDLVQALFTPEGGYRPEVVAVLDENADARLTRDELRLDSSTKVDAVAERLRSVGAINPRIRAEMQLYTVSHGMQSAASAIRCCQCCHGFESRVRREIELAAYVPGGVLPRVVEDATSSMPGQLRMDAGRLVFHPSIDPEVLYIHGTNHLQWLDIIGMLALVGAVLGAGGHAGLRILTDRRRKRESS